MRRYPLWALAVICAQAVEHNEVAFPVLSVAVPRQERLAR